MHIIYSNLKIGTWRGCTHNKIIFIYKVHSYTLCTFYYFVKWYIIKITCCTDIMYYTVYLTFLILNCCSRWKSLHVLPRGHWVWLAWIYSQVKISRSWERFFDWGYIENSSSNDGNWEIYFWSSRTRSRIRIHVRWWGALRS